MWKYSDEIFQQSMSNKIQLTKVYEVREKTGEGMLFCYSALQREFWDVQKAIKYLKDKLPFC